MKACGFEVEIQSTVALTPKERDKIVMRANALESNIVLVRLSQDGLALDCEFRKRNPSKVRPFERIRRITGYLVGTLERFNDAKRHEERDRVKHGGVIDAVMLKDGKTRREIVAPPVKGPEE